MSVRRPKNSKGEHTSPFYLYEFKRGGRRFYGSTKQTNERAAKAVERRKIKEAEALIEKLRNRQNAPMTVNEAFGRYWLEVGQFKTTADEIEAMLAWLIEAIGSDRLLSDIATKDVAELVARRRSEGIVIRRKARGKRPAEAVHKPISNARINRAVIEPLRRVMRRAKDVWGEPLTMPEWKRVRLSEPVERVREASGTEERNLSAAIRDDYAPALEFAFITGCRLAEIVSLTWDRVDWDAGILEVTGKGDRSRPIPITDDIRALLWPLQAHHSTAVFTYIAQKADRKRGIARGDRVPITYYGLKTRWRRDRAKSGVDDFRFHDTRRTVGTRVLRRTGNLKIVQQLLGHTNTSTTAKYAHAAIDDVREAMEQVAKSRKKARKGRRRTG